MSPSASSPQEHEARIAELRARRFARLRWLALRAVLLAGVLVLAGGLLLYWLLTTIGGRDVLLAQIVARLPADTTLTWQRAEGPAAGPLTLHGVHFAMPRQRDPDCIPTRTASCAMGRITFRAGTVVLDPALRPLLGRRLRLDALTIRDATLDVPRNDTPFKFPRWPDSLPQIAPPLSLQADTIRIDHLRVTRERAPLIVVQDARGGLDASSGRLHVEHLRVASDRGRFAAHGDYVPAENYRGDLVVTAVLPAPAGRSSPRLGLAVRGDLARMAVALAGRVPAPLRATLLLHGADAPHWTLRAGSEALDPALVLGSGDTSTPLGFALQADGVGGVARLRGSLRRADLAVILQPSRVTLRDQVLDVQPLVLDAFAGRTSVRGHVDLRDPARASLRFAINARRLQWGGTRAAPAVRADADFGLAGKPAAWAAIGTVTLQRERQRAQLRFDGSGDQTHVAIRALRATTPGGRLDANGRVQWSPQLQWQLAAILADIDPGYFLPDWNGALRGRVATQGQVRAGGGYDATFDVPQLGGRLRGRKLDAHGRLALRGANARGNVDAVLGGSHVTASGTVADRLDIDARFLPLQLDDLLPQGRGSLRGTMRLTGPRSTPDIAAELSGNGLRYAGYRIDALQARGHLPWRGDGGALQLHARGIQAGLALEAADLDARGAVEHLRANGNVQGTPGRLAFALTTDRAGKAWRGTLDTLQLTPTRGAGWRLQAPARYAQRGGGWTLASACFASSNGGSLCASADWPRHGLDVRAEALPLALATPYLPPRDDGRPWLLRGDIGFDAHLRPVGRAWAGTLHLASAGGGLRNSERARQELVAYDHLMLDARFDPQRVDARLGAGVIGNGRLDGHLDTGWDAYAPMRGEVALATDALTWMELLSPDIVEPTGHLAGRITLGGTRAQPALGGSAQLTGFTTELPALAITVSNGNARLDAQPDGTARIHGSLQSGQGTLAIDGSLGWRGGDTPLVLDVRGRNVLASDTRDLRAVIDPDVVVRYTAGQPLDVSGRVGVPSARIDLERLDQGVAASPDVVVLDPADPKRAVATPVALDLTLALGEDVRLSGFGLDGTLGGDLRVRAQPGRETLARGTLDVAGRYTAYGQKLDITRGRLVWSNTPIADPLLDVRAEREIGAVTAGIDVSGRASRPQADVWTDPASDQSEALALLALGRPLATASPDESRQLDAASAALSAGGSLLASQLGARIGLDEAGVGESRALGGSVFGVGKYLSPRLYVGYGVSLLGTGQVLTLKYLLRKGFDIEVESSTLENRASANWRKEK